VRAVIVDSGRWDGLSRDLPEHLVVDGIPPCTLVAEVREVRTVRGRPVPPEPQDQRDRDVLCDHLADVGEDVFYAPLPNQHADDEDWPHRARMIVRLRPSGT
jgi:hypothetical protein